MYKKIIDTKSLDSRRQDLLSSFPTPLMESGKHLSLLRICLKTGLKLADFSSQILCEFILTLGRFVPYTNSKITKE